MRPSENFQLKWNDFGENIASSFQELRRASDFSDVTLVSSDGDRVEAHRLVLSLSSSFFKEILATDHPQHLAQRPILLYMRGVDTASLSHLMDFIYNGEMKIEQDLLESFLALAGELGVKGLSKDTSSPGNNSNPENCNKDQLSGKSDPFEEANVFGKMETNIREDEECAAVENPNKKQKMVKVKNDKDLFEPSPRESIMEVSARLDKEYKPIILDDSVSSQNSATELDLKVDEILKNTDQGWSCSMCGIKMPSKTGMKTAMKRHIEAKHVTGFSHLCVLCGKTYATRHSLRSHTTGCKKEYSIDGSRQ